MSKENLPSYLSAASPNPSSNRAAWFKNTAPAYAGIMLWFVFWQDIPAGSMLSQGVCLPILAVIAAALLCFALFYWVPGMFGLKTGLPLYVVGSSIFGAKGGIVMPGLFMGILQFGWVAVNIFFSSTLLHETLDFVPVQVIMVVWGILAVFVGLKGIKYVAGISTFLPIIPFSILILLLVKTVSGVGSFDVNAITDAAGSNLIAGSVLSGSALVKFGIVGAIVSYMVGFFATAGAAGVDFGSGARNGKDVAFGGLVGISFAMIFTGVIAVLVIAGAYGTPEIAAELPKGAAPKVTGAMSAILGAGAGKTCMFLLALAAFPAACFSSLIAANSFKAMLPNVNANVSVAIGGFVAILLAVTGYAGDSAKVFGFIGASFGPICGAMLVDYFINGCKWSGPRAGFNFAGWAAWGIGFLVGVTNNICAEMVSKDLVKMENTDIIPVAPVSAFVVGALVYFICMALGLKSKVIDTAAEENAVNS